MKQLNVQVVQHLRPGGIETLVLDLQRLNNDRCSTHIISLEGVKSAALNHWPRLKAIEENLHFLDKPAGVSPMTLWRLVRLLRRLRPTSLHSHHTGPLLYGGLAARLCSIPDLIHTEHDAWHLDDSQRLRLHRRLIRLIRPILVADAGLVKERCERLLPGSNFRLIHNGIDTQRFSPGDKAKARSLLELPVAPLLVGCAARLEKVKGIDLLIRAIGNLDDPIHLAIAGQGSQEAALKRLVKELGVSQRVHFLGPVEEMPTFYRALDLFCLASHQEGLPLSPLEAQACEVPCVLTDAGGSGEALCPQSGILAPVNDVIGLTQALQTRLFNKINISPRQFVVEHRNVRRMASAYLSLPGQPL